MGAPDSPVVPPVHPLHRPPPLPPRRAPSLFARFPEAASLLICLLLVASADASPPPGRVTFNIDVSGGAPPPYSATFDPPDLPWGGKGGTIDVQLGVAVDHGVGPAQAVSGTVMLGRGSHRFLSVEPGAVLIVEGDPVLIQCLGLFAPAQIIGAYSPTHDVGWAETAIVPRLTVLLEGTPDSGAPPRDLEVQVRLSPYDGPLLPLFDAQGNRTPVDWLQTPIYTLDNSEGLPGGYFSLRTARTNVVARDLVADGAPGWTVTGEGGGHGGAGGSIRVSSPADTPLPGLRISAQGGDGADGGSNGYGRGGTGGDGGTVCARIAEGSGRASVDGGNGGNGALERVDERFAAEPFTQGPGGGYGGDGGDVRVGNDARSRFEVFAHGGRGGNGGRGPDGLDVVGIPDPLPADNGGRGGPGGNGGGTGRVAGLGADYSRNFPFPPAGAGDGGIGGPGGRGGDSLVADGLTPVPGQGGPGGIGGDTGRRAPDDVAFPQPGRGGAGGPGGEGRQASQPNAVSHGPAGKEGASGKLGPFAALGPLADAGFTRSKVRGWKDCRAGGRPTEFPLADIANTNGTLELECLDHDGCYEQQFVLRWRYPNDEVRFIGMCIWKCGENRLEYSYDRCLGVITGIRWFNAEGHRRPLRTLTDDCMAGRLDYYEIDEYRFDPLQDTLEASRHYYGITTLQWPFLFESIETDTEALAPRVLIPRRPAPKTIDDLCPYFLGSSTSPESAATGPTWQNIYLTGLAAEGSLRIDLVNRTWTLPLESGETPAAIADRLRNLLGQDPELRRAGIEAETNPARGDVPVAVSLSNLLEHEIAVEVTGQPAQGLRALRLRELSAPASGPVLGLTRDGARGWLVWDASPPTATLQVATNLAHPAPWTPFSALGDLQYRDGKAYLPLNFDGGPRFFRLVRP